MNLGAQKKSKEEGKVQKSTHSNITPDPGPQGGGGVVLSFFSAYVGSGPASTVHPKKYQEFQAPQKNI